MARAVTVRIPHELGKAEARRRIDSGFGNIEEQIGGPLKMRFENNWEGDRMHFTGGTFGQKVRGHVDVTEDEAVVEVVLPTLLAALAETVKDRLRRQGTRLLEHKE